MRKRTMRGLTKSPSCDSGKMGSVTKYSPVARLSWRTLAPMVLGSVVEPHKRTGKYSAASRTMSTSSRGSRRWRTKRVCTSCTSSGVGANPPSWRSCLGRSGLLGAAAAPETASAVGVRPNWRPRRVAMSRRAVAKDIAPCTGRCEHWDTGAARQGARVGVRVLISCIALPAGAGQRHVRGTGESFTGVGGASSGPWRRSAATTRRHNNSRQWPAIVEPACVAAARADMPQPCATMSRPLCDYIDESGAGQASPAARFYLLQSAAPPAP